MPKYNKKITRQMGYAEFKEGIQELPIHKQAFLSILFFAGVRVSEALALTSDDIHCAKSHEIQYDTGIIFVQFFRLKGSKQTDPIPLPRTAALQWICEPDPDLMKEGKLFPFSRRTAHRLVKKTFGTYPHHFRMNRITQVSEKFGDSYVYSYTGICAQSIDHYRGKVDIKKVGRALQKEVR